MFFSNDVDCDADFPCEKKYSVDKNVSACYDAYVCKSFITKEDAKEYGQNKRLVTPVRYESSSKVDFDPVPAGPVDFIEISDSEAGDDNSVGSAEESGLAPDESDQNHAGPSKPMNESNVSLSK